MATEVPTEIIAAGVGAVTTYAVGAVARWVRKPAVVDESAKRRDEVMARRVEDRFVLKETCEKCDRGFSGAIDSVRDYIGGVDKKVDGVEERVKGVGEDVRTLLRLVEPHISVNGKLFQKR